MIPSPEKPFQRLYPLRLSIKFTLSVPWNTANIFFSKGSFDAKGIA